MARLVSGYTKQRGMSLLASVSMIMPLTPRSHTVWPEHITGQEGGGEGGRHRDEGDGGRSRALFLCLCLFVL